MTTGFIIDIALIAVVLISLIIGLCKGLAKHFAKWMCRILALLTASVVSFMLMPMVAWINPNAPDQGYQQWYASTMDTCEGWFSDEDFSVPVENPEQLEEVMSHTFLRVASSKSEFVWNFMQEYNISTLGECCAYVICYFIIYYNILWFAIYFIAKGLWYGLRAILIRLAKIKGIHSIDKLLGLMLSAALIFVMASINLTAFEVIAIKFAPDLQPTAQSLVLEAPKDADDQTKSLYQTNHSSVLQFLHERNLIGSFVVDKVLPGQIDLENLTFITPAEPTE